MKPFIKNVLKLDITDNELKKAKIFREYQTENGRRIDVVIKMNCHFLPIEVKIYAWDLPNQCKDYYEEATKYCKDAKIFYLTPDGREPSQESSCGVTVNCISFRDIYEWISYCIGQPEIVRNAPIREILLQFAATVKKFAEQTEDDVNMEISKLITSSPDNMKAAISIFSVKEEILKKLRTDFFKAVESEMKARNENLIKKLYYYGNDTGTKSNYFDGLFYVKDKNDYDNTKPGIRLDVEHGIAYIGEFTPNSGKWGEDWQECTFDNNTPNFKDPNDALCELCNPEKMKKFAQECAEKIIKMQDDLKNKNNGA